MTDDAHRGMREALGPYVLGHLDETETARVRAHLDGCRACRAEHGELAPLAVALRDVDPDALDEPAEPGTVLGARIEAEIGAERARRNRRTVVQRTVLGLAACLVLVLAFVAGDRLTSDAGTPPVPLEAVAVTSEVEGVTARADLIDHTWGVEIQLTATGLKDGATYTTTVRDGGRAYPAGEFVGVAGVEIHCNMTASVLRDEATGFTVWNSQGQPVLRAAL